MGTRRPSCRVPAGASDKLRGRDEAEWKKRQPHARSTAFRLLSARSLGRAKRLASGRVQIRVVASASTLASTLGSVLVTALETLDDGLDRVTSLCSTCEHLFFGPPRGLSPRPALAVASALPTPTST